MTTNVVAVRIDDRIRKELTLECQIKNISINALASSILQRYIEWDRFVIRHGLINIPNEVFNKILFYIDNKNIIELAELTSKSLKKLATFSSGEATTDNLIKVMWYWFESANIQNRYLGEKLLIGHKYGVKGTLYLRMLINDLIKSYDVKIIEVQ